MRPLQIATSNVIFILFIVLQRAVAPAPPELTIGNINLANTLFNVGQGLTDESAAYNHIQINETPGTSLGLSNNPGGSPGTTFYSFTVLAPGCGAIGNTAVSIKTSYDSDGHLTGANTVDLELAVGIWGGTHYDILSDRSKFGVCIQADIFVIDGGNNPQVLESKQFDFVITPLLNDFSVNPVNLDTNAISKVTTDTLISGTTVTPHWAASSPLAPGEAVWFYLTIDTAPYVFTSFQEVQMTVGGGAPVSLVTGGAIVDGVLTSFELANGGTTMHFYHVLLRSKFATEAQQIALTGRANVVYSAGRRLDGDTAENNFEVSEYESQTAESESKEADFTVRAVMQPYDGSEEDSGGSKLEILSMMIGGAGLASAAILF
ncbi:hypothetical protein FisN_10Lh333 [Fistulifera solaris]|uniref:Uncharacterized protein n=1 Tax=Fistulifera solaris TaxID=1519565 RepID=A0A1Z5KFY4_FISSO|nr:hypothetical protein FisN_10Lh333 [Fistulifera solaris]|eukprot:GAX25127.1 hypothetical protein FisN_10Lh333 [Fistulifera solaris]